MQEQNMQEENLEEVWESYVRNVKGVKSAICVNTSVSMEVVDLQYTYPTAAFVKVSLKDASEEGLMGEPEKVNLLMFEKHLILSLERLAMGQFVGSIVSQALVTFVFYLTPTQMWDAFVADALLEGYEVKVSKEEDNEWKYYQKLLNPTPKEWRTIYNHKVCDKLQEEGDDLQSPRLIEHTLTFISEYKKADLLEDLEEEGFEIKHEFTNDKGYKGLVFSRIDKPAHADIDTLSLYLADFVNIYDAIYEGWQTHAKLD